MLVPVASLGAQLLLFGGGTALAKRMGGVPAGSRLQGYAREAAEAVGVPPPKNVYEIRSNEPNAFAAGIWHDDTTVAVTSGLTELLSERELKAVLAHEMGHLRHRDVSRNMQVAVAAAGIGGVYEAGRIILDISSRNARSEEKSKKSKDEKGDGLASAGMTLMVAGLGTKGLAHLLRLGASRRAELAADRAAAEAFGADSLISALRKINEGAKHHKDLRESSTGRQLAFAMISDGHSPHEGKVTWRTQSPLSQPEGLTWSKVSKAFSKVLRTHPPIDERVEALERAAASGLVPKGTAVDPWSRM